MFYLVRRGFYAKILRTTLVSEGSHYKRKHLTTTLKSPTCVGGNQCGHISRGPL